MTGRDPFSEGQEATEALRRAVEAIREDVRAVVREEVADAGLSEGDLERLVAELVRRNLAEARGRTPRWSGPMLLLVGVGVGLLAGAVGYGLLDGGSGTDPVPGGTTGSTAAPTGGAESGDSDAVGALPVAAASSPEALVARYDSLFDTRAPELESLMTDLDGVAAAPVLEARAAWQAGEALGPEPRRRLHDALVQAAVNRLIGAGLALDGLVTREPCGGASCSAVLRLWESSAGDRGLPPYPRDPGVRDAALPAVERVLVLRALEAPGG